MSFRYIYHDFCIPEFLMGECSFHADVGPMRPADYAQNMRRPRPEAAAAVVGGVAVVLT
jgi:hypothetical protein